VTVLSRRGASLVASAQPDASFGGSIGQGTVVNPASTQFGDSPSYSRPSQAAAARDSAGSFFLTRPTVDPIQARDAEEV